MFWMVSANLDSIAFVFSQGKAGVTGLPLGPEVRKALWQKNARVLQIDAKTNSLLPDQMRRPK
jgi:hypothetical protein